MLRIRGPREHFDKVLMPSECLHRHNLIVRSKLPFAEIYRNKVPMGHSLYWGIKVRRPRSADAPAERIAYLITADEVDTSRKRGSEIIVPAYPERA